MYKRGSIPRRPCGVVEQAVDTGGAEQTLDVRLPPVGKGTAKPNVN